MRFLLQFHNVLIYLLLVSAAITGALGHGIDTAVILGVVLINAIVGFVQEGKAESAMAAIRKMLSPHAMVLRDEQRRKSRPRHWCPATGCCCNRATRYPPTTAGRGQKSADSGSGADRRGRGGAQNHGSRPAEAALGDRRSMAYSGTLVSYGQGLGVVVATGEQTEIGRISILLEQVEAIATPRYGRWRNSAAG